MEKRNEKEPKMNGFRGVHFLERPPYNLTGCPKNVIKVGH